MEDNLDSLKSLSEILKADGHVVQAATDGHAALALIELFAPDIVLLDLGLPGIDGYAVCELIRAKASGRRTRVIAVTTHTDSVALARSVAAGFDSHLVKPYDPADLLAAVNARN